jgi:hypothetical protein
MRWRVERLVDGESLAKCVAKLRQFDDRIAACRCKKTRFLTDFSRGLIIQPPQSVSMLRTSAMTNNLMQSVRRLLAACGRYFTITHERVAECRSDMVRMLRRSYPTELTI